MTCIIIISLIISILLIIILYKTYQKNKTYKTNKINKTNKDTFINQSSNASAHAANDGDMTFDYLLNNNNTYYILNRYYLNDDIKNAAGTRLNYHPYNRKNNLGLYGNPAFQIKRDYNNTGNSYLYITENDYIYNTYGVRR